MLNILKKFIQNFKIVDKSNSLDDHIYNDICISNVLNDCDCDKCFEAKGDELGFIVYYDYEYINKFYGDDFGSDLKLNNHQGEKFYSTSINNSDIFLIKKKFTEPDSDKPNTKYAKKYKQDKNEWLVNYENLLRDWFNTFSERIIPKEELDNLIESKLKYPEHSTKDDIFLGFKKLVSDINDKDDLEKNIIYMCIKRNYVPFKNIMFRRNDFKTITYSSMVKELKYVVKSTWNKDYDAFYDTTNDIYELTNSILCNNYGDYFFNAKKDLNNLKLDNFKISLEEFNYVMTSDDVLRVLPIVNDFYFFLEKLELNSKSMYNSDILPEKFNNALYSNNLQEYLLKY